MTDFVFESLRKDGEKYREQYYQGHKCCPICGSTKSFQTLKSYVLDLDNMEDYKDLNECKCSKCNSKHTVHERVPK